MIPLKPKTDLLSPVIFPAGFWLYSICLLAPFLHSVGERQVLEQTGRATVAQSKEERGHAGQTPSHPTPLRVGNCPPPRPRPAAQPGELLSSVKQAFADRNVLVACPDRLR